MSRPTRKKWRLNARAAIILGAIAGVGLFTLAMLSYVNTQGSASALLRQAEAQAQADPPRYDLALNFLNEYLRTLDPDDPAAFEALRRKSEILEQFAFSAAEWKNVVQTCQQALRAQPKDASGEPRIDPDDPGALEVRRRLVRGVLAQARQDTRDVGLNVAEEVASAVVYRDAAYRDTAGNLLPPPAIPEEAGYTEVLERAKDRRQLGALLNIQAILSENAPARADARTLIQEAHEVVVDLLQETDNPRRTVPLDELDATIERELIPSALDLVNLYQFSMTAGDANARNELTARGEAIVDELVNVLRNIEDAARARDPDASIDRSFARAYLLRHARLARMADEEPLAHRRGELLDRADDEMQRTLKRRPRDPEVLLAAAEHAVRRGQIDAARRYFEDLEAESQESLQGRLVQARINLVSDQPDAAIASLRLGLESVGGTDSSLTAELALLLLQLGKLDEAEPLIRQHGRLPGGIDPDTGEPTAVHRYLVGLSLLQKDQRQAALEEFQKIVFARGVNDRLKAQAHLAMARTYRSLGEIVEATEQFRQASQTFPRWSVPYLDFAEMLQQSGTLTDALGVLEAGLIAEPGDPALSVARTRTLMQIELSKAPDDRDWSRVEAALADARERAPTSPALARIEADLLTVRGNLNGAAALLEQAIRHNPKAGELWVAWAGVLIRMRQHDQALIVLQQAAAPGAAGDSGAIRVLTARLLAAAGKGQQAIGLLSRDASGLPVEQRVEILAELGNQYRQRGQLGEARRVYESWAQLQPESPQPHSALIELARLTGDAEAVEAAEAALEGLGDTPQVRIARVQNLLREDADEVGRAVRLAEADTLITELENDAVHGGTGTLLRGLHHERYGRPEEAIDAYTRALESGTSRPAAARLILLYSKLGRIEELRALRARLETGDLTAGATAGGTTVFDRLTTAALLDAGRMEEAEQTAAEVVAGNPESLDARVWQARVLNSTGKPEEAEASLRALAEQSTEPGPWLALLAHQVSRRDLDGGRATTERIKTTVEAENLDLLLGQCYRLIGDLPAAEAAFEAARARNPEDRATIAALASFYEATGQIDRAVELLREPLQGDPEARWAARPLALLRSRQAGGWEEAWQLAQLPDGAEDTPEEQLTRGLVLSRSPEAGRREEAVAALEGLIADLPPDQSVARAAREVLTRLYLALGDNTKLTAMTAVNAASGTNPQAIAQHAEVLLRSGQVAEARRQLQRLEQNAPRSIVTAKLRALVLKAEDKPEEAARSLERAFGEHRADPDGGRAAGREFLTMLGAQEGDPTRPPAIPGQLEVAESLARAITAAWPADSWLLGRILARQEGRTGEAVNACLATAQARNATPHELREAAALAVGLAVGPHGTKADREVAERVIRRAREADPESPEMMIFEGYLRHAQGRYQEEVDLYLAARDRRPVNPLYLNNLAWGLGQELDRPSEALEVIDGLLATIHDDSRYDQVRLQCYDTRGVILTRLGKYAEAIADLERAVEGNPDSPIYLYHLAHAYALDGQEDQFRAYRDRALEAGLTPDDLEPSEREEMQRLLER